MDLGLDFSDARVLDLRSGMGCQWARLDGPTGWWPDDRPRAHLYRGIGDSENVRESCLADLLLLPGSRQVDFGAGQFCVGTGSVCSRPQLVVDQHPNGLLERLAALHIRIGRVHGLLRR